MGIFDWMADNMKKAEEQKLSEIAKWSDDMIQKYLAGHDIGVTWADNDTTWYYVDLVEKEARLRGIIN